MDDYNPFAEQDELLSGDFQLDYLANTTSSTDAPLFDLDAILQGLGNHEEDVPLQLEDDVSKFPDVNVEAMMEERISKAKEILGTEVDEDAFFENVSKMNTFSRLSVLVDEIKKDPTEWFLYLYLKHTNYKSMQSDDDFSIRIPEERIDNNRIPDDRIAMGKALNTLNKSFEKDPTLTTIPVLLTKLSNVRNTDDLRVNSTVMEVKSERTIYYDYAEDAENEFDKYATEHLIKKISESGYNVVKRENQIDQFYLRLDENYIIGDNSNVKFGLDLHSVDGSANLNTGYISTVFIRRSDFKMGERYLSFDVRTIRPFDVSGLRFFGLNVTENGGFKNIKNALNKCKIPYLVKYRNQTGIHFLAFSSSLPNRIHNSIFYRNLYLATKQNSLPFDAYNLTKYCEAIPGADLLNFAFNKNINGTLPCDAYCSRYYNPASKTFKTPNFLPHFKPSDGRCMNYLECNCFVANYQDILSFSKLQLGFEDGRQKSYGNKKICTFCGTGYHGEKCNNREHRTRVASRLKNIQNKFRNVEENLKDPCAECALILRRMNSPNPGTVVMEDSNIASYEQENPNTLLIATLLEHYAGANIVVDAETKAFITPFSREVACNIITCDMANYDHYSKYKCSKPLCGRIKDWKKLSAISDTVLATQMKLQDSNEKMNDPDALLSALGITENAVAVVKAQSIPYLGGVIQEEVKKIAKRLNNDTTATPGTKETKKPRKKK